MRSYRVGIIGCGPRAQHHADALRRMPEAELVGAADPMAERLDAFAAKWEIPHAYTSAADLLQAQKLDLVTITTLPAPKAALVEQCAAAGVPAINIEKPAAYTLAEIDRMLQACERSGSLLTVNHQMRFMQQFLAVRELVRAGRLGEITFLRVGSKGHLTEQGPHTVDQMLFMNNDEPAEWILGGAEGTEGYDLKQIAPTFASASVQFRNGVRGFVEAGLRSPEVDPNGGFWLQKFIEVTGTRGWAGAYVNRGWQAVLDSGEVLSGPGTWEPNWDPQGAFFHAALEWIDDREKLHPCRGEVARRGLELLLGVCQSAIDRSAVTLPLNPTRDPLRELKPLLADAVTTE